MSQSSRLLNTLKKVMKSKQFTYADLAKALDLSESSIKRIFAEGSFTLKRLEKICDILGLSIAELVKKAELDLGEKSSRLTVEQEEILSLNLDFFRIFYLLLKQWNIEDIRNQFNLDKNDLLKVLLNLDKLALIELLPNDRIKLLTNRNIKWRKNGPIYKIFEEYIKNSFFKQDFSKEGEGFSFLTGSISKPSRLMLKAKIDQFSKEIEDIIEMDIYLDKEQTETVGLVMGFGALEISLLSDHADEDKK